MKISYLVCVLLSMQLCGCAAQRQQQPERTGTLYERLGGMPAIEAVVDELYRNMETDERINGYFIGTHGPELARLLSEQMCAATGGPCTYSGRDMESVHTGMNITAAQFEALLQDLRRAMDHFQVPAREQQEVLALLGGMKASIIDR